MCGANIVRSEKGFAAFPVSIETLYALLKLLKC